MKKSDVLEGTAADFKGYLGIGSLDNSKPYNSTVDVKAGVLFLQIKKDQPMPEAAYLVLVNEEKTAERIIIRGDIAQESVAFRLAASDVPGPSDCASWLAYYAYETDEDCYTARIKRNIKVKEPATKAAAEKNIFSRLISRAGKKHEKSSTANGDPSDLHYGLWKASEVYTDTGIERIFDGIVYKLTLRFTAKGQRMSLRWISEEEALPLFDGKLHYMRREEKPDKADFDFSVVMAVYKVEDYLREAIDSLIAQDIGFEEHIQLILVDDGSPDRSGEICDEYAELYPNNIQVIHKENGGVASARNEGLKAVKGQYINFMDSDDKMSENTFSTVKEFFDRRYHLTDIVTVPIYFFEGKSGAHWQNYKFNKGARIINLWDEPSASDMSTSASFFKKDSIEGIQFDSTLPNAEDLLFIAQILLKKMQLGVVTNCVYWYRRRAAGGSLINTSVGKKSWYIEYFDNMVFRLLDESAEKYGRVPEFIQHTLMMDIQWRFHIDEYPEGLLTDTQKQEYVRRIVRALQAIDDRIILVQRNMTVDHMAQAFQLKYEKPLPIVYTEDNYHILANNRCLRSGSALATFYDFITIDQKSIIFEGSTVLIGLPETVKIRLFMMIGGDYYECELVQRDFVEHNCFGRIKNQVSFRVKVPIRKQYFEKRFRLVVQIDNHYLVKRRYIFHKFTPFFGMLPMQYYRKGKVQLTTTREGILLSEVDGENAICEADFIGALEENVLPEEVLETRPVMPGDLTRERFEAIKERRAFALNYKKERPVWLVSDRIDRAGDNGEALFIYLMKQPSLPADVYFVVDGESDDYARLSKVGPVLAFGSEEHLKMHLVADLLVSSQGEDFVFTPFGADDEFYGVRKYYADLLCDQKFVFLQHGITKDDLSDWLNRYKKNITGFITATDREYDSVLTYPYYYDKKNVWNTGFARFDLLYEDNKKRVVVCPTWRKYLRDLTDKQFEESEYYQFYARLLRNKELQKVLQAKGYHLCLRLHPSMMQFIDFFANLEDVELLDDNTPYRQIYAESSLLVTDYSSTAMDFAYLRKPVIYTQFDQEKFFGGDHTYKKGYFDYQTDGFGPVVTTVEEAVAEIKKLAETDFDMSDIYRSRADAFFPVNDYQNSQRIYEKLKEISGELICEKSKM